MYTPIVSPAVEKYLSQRGLSVIASDELERLQARPEHPPPVCPYPTFSDHYGGISHRRYMGQICKDTEKDDPMTGLVVMRCEACGHVEFELPVVYAMGGTIGWTAYWSGSPVDKVQQFEGSLTVTEENVEEVAKLCGGWRRFNPTAISLNTKNGQRTALVGDTIHVGPEGHCFVETTEKAS